MKLLQLLNEIEVLTASPLTDAEVGKVTCDSRAVAPDAIFVAVKGERYDGHDYASQAVSQGAVAVITERDLGLERQVIVKDSRSTYALLNAALFGHPSRKLKLIGVTGTNGKTTITYLLKQILESAGKKVGLIGTIQVEIDDMCIPAKHTTPDPAELHSLFSRMVNARCEYVVMEASSHAFAQHRLDGCHFAAGVFTNLTQDHLDYHGTMENYYNAKKQLFEMSDISIINLDDEYGKRLLTEIPCKTITYSAGNDMADFTAKNIVKRRDGVNFALVGSGIIERVSFGMPGSFSVSNAMAAAACAITLGFEPAEVAKGLSICKGVKGRTEVLYSGVDFTIICDYAHTPDGLEKVLSTIREFAPARVVVMFGCAGNRDRTKRPKMAHMAAQYSDLAVLTSDNPRDEDVMQILNDAVPGFKDLDTEYRVIPDRMEAIKWVLDNAQQDDIIVLAGKGHEDYQVLNFGTIAFDEHTIVKELIAKRDKKRQEEMDESPADKMEE